LVDQTWDEISQDAAPVTPDPNLLQKAGETRHLRAPNGDPQVGISNSWSKEIREKVPAQKDHTSGHQVSPYMLQITPAAS
jgi:hypothetical protein